MTTALLILTVLAAWNGLPLAFYSDAPPVPRVQSAIAVWEEYQGALRDGDEEKARTCWTGAARRYPVFDFNLKFDHAVWSARNDSVRIVEATENDSYVALHVSSPHWKQTAWSGPPDRTYYVVQDSAAHLANPTEVLTDGWQQRTTEHFVLHYPKDGRLTDEQVNRLEESYRETSSGLGVSLDRRIDYYKCDSAKTVGALLGSGPAAGRAGIEDWIVAAMGWTSHHEVVHVLTGQLCRRQPPSPIMEGAACYFGGAGFIAREAQLAWAKTLVEHDEAMPLATLLDERGFWSAAQMNDPYAEAAAFNGFLIDRYGVEAYKALYRLHDESDSLPAALRKLSGRTLPQLEKEWEDWLADLDVPTIELPSLPGTEAQATEIFRMDDPPHDDNGDGHFVYPLAPAYQPGMFDLTRFRVLSDATRVCFELTYRDLVEWPETSAWGFGGTFTRIAIDGGGPGDDEFFTFRWGTNATLEGSWDYLIDVSDCGVVLVRDGRVAACLKRGAGPARLGDAAQNRICFSVPCDASESARREWRYAVAVGGCGDRGRHFRDLAGGFLAVAEEPSEHIGGGGSPDSSNTNVYDILLPADQEQAKILAGRPAIVPMVGPSRGGNSPGEERGDRSEKRR